MHLGRKLEREIIIHVRAKLEREGLFIFNTSPISDDRTIVTIFLLHKSHNLGGNRKFGN